MSEKLGSQRKLALFFLQFLVKFVAIFGLEKTGSDHFFRANGGW